MATKIGSSFTFQATAPKYVGPLRETVTIHEVSEKAASDYLTTLGYSNLILVPAVKRGPKVSENTEVAETAKGAAQ